MILPFVVWGADFETALSPERLAASFRDARAWAWLAGMGLLVADLFLPVPGTAVMSALGLVYGWFLGGLLSAAGSVGAGMLAYGLCRKLGRRTAQWIAGKDGIAEGERLFQGEPGPWIVALSRWMPVLPEAVACLAGISRMPWRRFFSALCVGSVPMGFVFAWIGHRGEAQPALALLVSAALPPLIWMAVRLAMRRLKARTEEAGD